MRSTELEESLIQSWREYKYEVSEDAQSGLVDVLRKEEVLEGQRGTTSKMLKVFCFSLSGLVMRFLNMQTVETIFLLAQQENRYMQVSNCILSK